ncbi:MAG: hypothetical protein GDA46_01810 [Bdellovibrionales bacterium]|nr:hypothetical protein [Bdellovibrionales bacterium]
MISRKKIKRSFLIVITLTLFFALGLFFGLNSWKQNLYVSWKPIYDRGLAEESEEILLNVSSKEVIRNPSEFIFENIVSFEEEGVLNFYIGSFLIPNPQTQEYGFLCDVFSHVEFSFFALGISINGDPGRMLVQSPCRLNEDLQLGPFFIPKNQLMAQADQRFFEFEEMETYVRFYKSSTALMSRWFLKTIRFFNLNEQGNEGNQKDFIVTFDSQINTPFEVVFKLPEEKTKLILKQRTL